MSESQDLSYQIKLLSVTNEQEQSSILNTFIEEGLESGSIALILEAFPIEVRIRLWRALPLELHIEVLTEMRSDVRFSIIDSLSKIELKLTLAKLDNLSLIEWADSLPEEIINEAIRLIEQTELELYDQASQFEEDELGRWAERKVATLPFNINVEKARLLMHRYNYDIRRQVYLINHRKQFKGVINCCEIFLNEDDVSLMDLAISNITTLHGKLSLQEAIEALEYNSLPALPMIDDNQILIGEVNWQFALNTQRQIYETRLVAGTGVNKGADLFAPVLKSVKKRSVWLGVNLLAAMLVASTISLFDDVIEQVVVLAVMMPVVASMGGVSGSQTLTMVVRAMALNQIVPGNRLVLLKNELSIGVINGLFWASIAGGISALYSQSILLGGITLFAIVVNMSSSVLCGVLIPIVLRKFNLDPALAGSMVLTTTCDIVGFFAFLGTASLILL
ncbi:magnesium transporter [Candidatus Photodesmus katoptron]|uniref:Divalent cation transporter n=1 Tax=Candidatus Photodesmus katoptron Akat1 TaxID=1236703 RepID=S3E0Y7_9GAMM|nr:magnesium transporter [Candidatus Photodesmus katoptron]EPE37816.1 divalent cation transporter [Candidatus Photodesmus katoptron Akat1]KEY90465.1 magnesium transporter [Candidatus Photodesmus katoptron]